MLDRALSRVFANFSTLLLVACVVTIPMHVVHAYVFRDVLAVRELAPEIQRFPEGRQVRGVARSDLDAETNWSLILFGVELLFLPVVYRGARRVMMVADEGGVPSVLDAYRNLRGTSRTIGESSPLAIAGGVSLAVLCAVIVWRVGALLSDMLSAETTWAGVGLSRAAAVATALALAGGTAAALARPVDDPSPPDVVPDVY